MEYDLTTPKARTILEMLTSGDVIIRHPGPNWSFAICTAALEPEDFNVLLTYSMENHPSQKGDK